MDGAGKARGRAAKADGESAALEKIAAIPGAYRAMGVRLHAIIKASAPGLVPRVWYGMPAYARDGKVVCFFRGALNERYMTLGFSEAAQVDEGGLWPTALALQQLGEGEEARISALGKWSRVKKLRGESWARPPLIFLWRAVDPVMRRLMVPMQRSCAPMACNFPV